MRHHLACGELHDARRELSDRLGSGPPYRGDPRYHHALGAVCVLLLAARPEAAAPAGCAAERPPGHGALAEEPPLAGWGAAGGGGGAGGEQEEEGGESSAGESTDSGSENGSEVGRAGAGVRRQLGLSPGGSSGRAGDPRAPLRADGLLLAAAGGGAVKSLAAAFAGARRSTERERAALRATELYQEGARELGRALQAARAPGAGAGALADSASALLAALRTRGGEPALALDELYRQARAPPPPSIPY